MNTDKLYYNGHENLEAKINIHKYIQDKQEDEVCYLQLLSSKQILFKELILRLRDSKTTYKLPLSGLDTGIYCLRLVSNNPYSVSAIWIGVNIPNELQNNSIPPTFTLYPEGGQALIGITQKFLGTLTSPLGVPLQKTILIRNNQNHLIAAGKTNTSGIVTLKIPLVKDDVYTVSTTGGEILAVYNTNDTTFSKAKGFTIQANHADGQLLAEAWRGIAESKSNTKLQLYLNDNLLFETVCRFSGDTNIIATSFPLRSLTNRPLKLVLIDDNGYVYATRYYFVYESSQSASPSSVAEVLPCLDIQSCISDINDRLISNTNFPKVLYKQGFSLFFENKKLPNTLVNYTIMDERNVLLQVGQSESDNNGILELSECAFAGQAYVQFYDQGKVVSGYNIIRKQNLKLYTTEKITSEIGKLLLHGTDSAERITSRHIIGNMQNKEEAILEEVTVRTKKKSRIEELDEIYVSNGMFRDMNSINIDVESDGFARNYKPIMYALKFIPGLNTDLKYRGGYIDIYLDEALIDKELLKDMFMGDIAYMKFFKNPVRGGMAAEKGGAILKRDSYAAGLQGSLALYTKKYVEKNNSTASSKGILVYGYVN